MTSPAQPARRRRASRTFSFALAGAAIAASSIYGLLAATPSSAAAAKGAPAPGSPYVALGDSYAAGYGIAPPSNKPIAGCAQSAKDYPHQVAAALHLKLTDVSCSGAVTADIDQNGQDTGSGTAPQQDTVLSSKTKLVTVTIGGNDLGFATIAGYCVALSPAGPVAGSGGSNCKAHYYPQGGVDSLAATTRDTVVPRVARVLADIKHKAPNAAVYFVDYPAISTTKAGSPSNTTLPYPDSCYSSPVTGTNPPAAAKDSFPFTGIDTAYLQQVQQYLNAQVKQQVVKSSDHFVESYPQSLAHSACHGTTDPWLNGVTLDLSKFPAISTQPGSLHPNLEGADHLATETLAAIGPYVAPRTSAPPSSSAPATHSSPSHSAAAAGGAPLANTGYPHVLSLTLAGGVLVLGGGLLLVATRAGSRRGIRVR